MLYEIMNPSDVYTMEAEDEKVAIAACVILGEGQYGLQGEDDETVCPVLAFCGNVDAWLTDTFGMELCEYTEQHKQEVATALGTVTIGDFEDRKQLERVLGAIEDQATKDKVVAEWHDSHRSSMNDIGARAQAMSRYLHGTPTEVPRLTPVVLVG